MTPLLNSSRKEISMPKITLVAIAAIFILCLVALLKEVNGAIQSTGVAIIAGLGGYSISRKTHPKP